MPISISITSLSWLTPDSTPLFTDLNLNFGPERTGIVGRNGTGKSTLLNLIAGKSQPAAGQIQLSGTIAFMQQDAIERPDNTIADLFGATSALAVLERADSGMASVSELAEADWTLPQRMEAALLASGLSVSPQTPLLTLSGGQRSRAALAALIFAQPDFLLLDEPTNNLDRSGRQAVIDIIRSWKAGAIIVSHDRELLEEMDAIIELTSLGVTRYGGNYSAFRQQKDRELDAAFHALASAEKASKEAAHRAQTASERKARRDSAGRSARAKRDQPKILMDAAKGRAEATDGTGTRLRDSRREAAEAMVQTARKNIEVLQPMRMDIAPTGLPAGKQIVRLDNVTVGYDPDHPVIHNISLTITGPECILLAGPNGSGKTSLIKLITGQLKPQQGSVERMVPFALLDQHVSLLDLTKSLLENFQRINPGTDAHMAHAALARFGFRAADALRLAGDLSGGERLRAGLACTLGALPPPMLLILDEPTNHLDLDAIAALESALAAYDGAMLVVSHDETFIKSLNRPRVLHLVEGSIIP